MRYHASHRKADAIEIDTHLCSARRGNAAVANAIWLSMIGGDLLVQGDVNGDTVADFEVQFVAVAWLEPEPFLQPVE